MALQIADRAVVEKIEALARATGLSETEAVERAVDRLLAEQAIDQPNPVEERFDAILAQLDHLPQVKPDHDPLHWDEHGLPR